MPIDLEMWFCFFFPPKEKKPIRRENTTGAFLPIQLCLEYVLDIQQFPESF